MTPINIMLIDDEDVARESLADLLREFEFNVAEYGHGRLALDALKTQWQEFNAIVLDFVLDPPWTGERVLRTIGSLYPNLPVIVITGQDHEGGIRQLSHGAAHYLPRSLAPKLLPTIVKSLSTHGLSLAEIVTDLRHLLQSELCIAWRLDRKNARYYIASWNGKIENDYVSTVFLPAYDETMIKYITEGRPIFIKDVRDQFRAPFYRYRTEAIAQEWRDLVSIPLKYEGRSIGFLDCYNSKRFELNDTAVPLLSDALIAFANQASKVVWNIELSTRLTTLQNFNQILAGAFDENSILAPILTKAIELVGGTFGWIFLVDFNKGILTHKISEKIPEALVGLERAFGEGITGIVAKTGQFVNEGNVQNHPGHLPIQGFNIHSEVAVPLRRDEQVIGVLTIKSEIANAFSVEDVDLLISFATLAALTIERTKVAGILHEISWLGSTGNKNTLLEYVVTALRGLTGSHATFWQVKHQSIRTGRLLEKIASTYEIGAFESVTLPFELMLSPVVQAWQSLQIERVTLPAHRNFIFTGYLTHLEAQKLRAVLVVPILGRNEEFLGLISLYSETENKFKDTDLSLITIIVKQIALALQNLGFLERERILRDVSSAINRDNDIANVAEEILFGLARVVEFRTATVQEVVDRSTERIHLAQLGIHKSDKYFVRPLDEDVFMSDKLHPKTPYILTDTNDKSSGWEQHPGTEMVKSWALLPLVYEEQVLGLITLDHPVVGYYKENLHADLFAVFANQAAGAIYKARLLQERDAKIEELEILNKIVTRIQLITMEAEASDLLQIIVKETREALSCTHCALFERNEDEGEMKLVATHMDGAHAEQIKSRTFKIGEGIAGKVFQTGKSIIVPNTLSHPDFSPARAREYQPRSLLVVPIFIAGKPVGVISADDEKINRFNENDRLFVETLAHQVGIALQRTLLFHKLEQQRKSQLESIRIIADLISADQSEDDVLGEILNAVLSLFSGAEMADITYLSRNSGSLIPQMAKTKDGADITHLCNVTPIGEYVIGDVAKTGLPKIVKDTSKETGYCTCIPGMRSEIAVPMFDKQHEVIGVLNIEHPDFSAFSEEDIPLAVAIAELAEVAYEKYRYIDKLKRLQEVAAEIFNDPANEQIVLHKIVDNLSAIFDGAPCAIRLFDRSTNQFVKQSVGTQEVPPVLADRKPRPKGVSWYVKNNGAYYVDDVQARERGKPAVRKDLIAQGIRSVAVLPLQIGEEFLGVLWLNLRHKHFFSSNDREILTLFNNLAEVAVKTAKLIHQIREQQKQEILAIGSSAKAITLADPAVRRASLVNVVKSLAPLMGTDTEVTIWSFDEKSQLLKPEFHNVEHRGERIAEIKVGQGVIGSVFKNGRSQLVDIATARDYVPGYPGAVSELAVIIQSRSHKIGVLNIESRHQLEKSDKDLAQSIADIAAVAMTNAILYSQLESLYQVAIDMNQKQDVIGSLYLLASSLKALVKADITAIYPYDRKHKHFTDGVYADDGMVLVATLRETDLEIFAKMPEGHFEERRRNPVIIRNKLVRATATIPLINNAELVGIMYIDFVHPHTFSESEKRIITLFAILAASEISNAKTTETVQQLIRAKSWVQVGQLTANLAHRISNTGLFINETVGSIETILDQEQNHHDKLIPLLEKIKNSNASIMHLAADLFKPVVAANEPLESSSLPLLIEQAISTAQLPEDILIQRKFDPLLPEVPANRYFVEIFHHLILNAVKAMEDSAKKRLLIRLGFNSDYAIITIADSGKGIPESSQEEIFNLGVSSSREGNEPHYGFGLWWVRTFLRNINGDIQLARASLSGGATFKITVPLGDLES